MTASSNDNWASYRNMADLMTEKEFKMSKSSKDTQIGGDHYKKKGIQPIEYIAANNLNFFEGNVIKYVTRHRDKEGKADLEKAIHYLQLLVEYEYPGKIQYKASFVMEPTITDERKLYGTCPACDEAP